MKTSVKTFIAAAALCGVLYQTPAQAWFWNHDKTSDASLPQYAPGLRLSHADVAGIQEILKEDGYHRVAVNGDWNRRTQTALADFQASHGLQPTGAPSLATLNRLGIVVGETRIVEGSQGTYAVTTKPENIEPAAGGGVGMQPGIILYPNELGVAGVNCNHENGASCLTCTNGIFGNGSTPSMRSNEY
jgi:hypothetical protein